MTKARLFSWKGGLKTRSWQDKESVTRKTTEIVAESIQFGPRAGPREPAEKVVQSGDDEPVISLDDDEIRPEDISF